MLCGVMHVDAGGACVVYRRTEMTGMEIKKMA
jgi:hypothetical protein